MKIKILLVDDEKDIIDFLSYNLVQEGFDVVTAYNGVEALEKLSEKPDFIILDVMMPKMDGYETCSRIRAIEEFKNIPIMFLTAKSSEIDEVHGLSIGADDFIQKPISPKKLLARVIANSRKLETNQTQDTEVKNIKIGALVIDRNTYEVTIKGKTVFFPKKEFEILFYLASNPGKVFDREKILSDVWGDDIYVVARTIDVHVRKIREKLGNYSDLIETIKGVGYKFKNIE